MYPIPNVDQCDIDEGPAGCSMLHDTEATWGQWASRSAAMLQRLLTG